MPELVFNERVTGLQAGVNERVSITGGSLNELNESIPGSSTDLEVALVIDVSQMKAIALLAEGGNLTLEFNDGTTPDKTLTMVDGRPFLWHNLSQHANPFGSTDVTALFVTKAGAGAVTLRGAVLVDPTV